MSVPSGASGPPNRAEPPRISALRRQRTCSLPRCPPHIPPFVRAARRPSPTLVRKRPPSPAPRAHPVFSSPRAHPAFSSPRAHPAASGVRAFPTAALAAAAEHQGSIPRINAWTKRNRHGHAGHPEVRFHPPPANPTATDAAVKPHAPRRDSRNRPTRRPRPPRHPPPWRPRFRRPSVRPAPRCGRSCGRCPSCGSARRPNKPFPRPCLPR